MNEEDAVAKVQELMVNLDRVKKHKEIALSSLRCLKYLLLATVALLFIEIAYALGGYFYGFYNIHFYGINNAPFLAIVNGINLLFFLIGLLLIALYEDRKAAHYRPGDWSAELAGGLPGALKLLSELDWEAIVHDMKYAKMGLLVGVIGNITVASILIYILLGIAVFFSPIFHAQWNAPIAVFVSILLATYLLRKDADRGLRTVWGMDYLASDLRWLYGEFRGAKFEA